MQNRRPVWQRRRHEANRARCKSEGPRAQRCSEGAAHGPACGKLANRDQGPPSPPADTMPASGGTGRGGCSQAARCAATVVLLPSSSAALHHALLSFLAFGHHVVAARLPAMPLPMGGALRIPRDSAYRTRYIDRNAFIARSHAAADGLEGAPRIPRDTSRAPTARAQTDGAAPHTSRAHRAQTDGAIPFLPTEGAPRDSRTSAPIVRNPMALARFKPTEGAPRVSHTGSRRAPSQSRGAMFTRAPLSFPATGIAPSPPVRRRTLLSHTHARPPTSHRAQTDAHARPPASHRAQTDASPPLMEGAPRVSRAHRAQTDGARPFRPTEGEPRVSRPSCANRCPLAAACQG